MSNRFYSTVPITADRVALTGPEAHHLLHVMRAKEGDRVTLFDGTGIECHAEIVRCGRADVELDVLARHSVDRELPFELVAGVSLPKGERQKWLVEKLTELGVTALVPLVAARGVAQPTASAIERLERTVIEAAKQCGGNRLMAIAKPQAWESWLASGNTSLGGERSLFAAASPLEPRRLVAHPDGVSIAGLDLAVPAPTYIAIGPEGGFTDDEVAAATAAGWQRVDLGPRILRVETATVVLSAVVALSARS